MTSAAPRLFVIQARSARTAVIFRRGPAKQVLLLTWNLKTDEIVEGQWFKGRIYERRCDLSPSGRLLIYFAAKHTGPFGTWTAVSKPPYLTALALWPSGDTYGGGGFFGDEATVLINARYGGCELAPGFALKRGMTAQRCDMLGRDGGEIFTWSSRLQRGGWTPIGDSISGYNGDWMRRDGPVMERKAPDGRRLEMFVGGRLGPTAPWYRIDYLVRNKRGEEILSLGRTDWADWDGNDLLYARDGCLFRLEPGQGPRPDRYDTASSICVADLGPLKFAARPAPDDMARW